MEARVNGIVRQIHKSQIIKLLTVLAGASPWPIEIHEILLEQRQKTDVVLHRYRVASNEVYEAGTRWTCSHYSKPPWGDKVLESLNASIRLVKEAKVPSARTKQTEVSIRQWEGEGYTVRYHLVKDGVTCDVMSPDGVRLHVFLYGLFKGTRVEQAHGDTVERGEQYEPADASIIEVWTHIDDPSAGHEKSLGGIAWLNALLTNFSGVELHPLAEKRKVLQEKRTAMLANRGGMGRHL